MICINDGTVQYMCISICLFLFYLNPNCRVLCDGAKEVKEITIKYCDVPSVSPHTNITYKCTKYVKNESESCVFNGTVFESTSIKISCDPGYSTNGEDSLASVCNGNEWVPPITGCSKKCKKLNPVNVHLECFRKNISIPCDERYLVSGVTVRPTCEHLSSSGVQFYPGHHEIHCQEDGNWDNDLHSCVQDCGRLQKNSSDSETWGMPWDVIILRETGHALAHVCFGTIISPRVILTSEYCMLSQIYPKEFDKPMRRPFDPTVLKIGIMSDIALHHQNKSTLWEYIKNAFKRFTLKIKEFRYFKHGKQDESFLHDVLIVILEEEIKFNSHVSPACVQWENPNRLNIPTGIAKVQQYDGANEEGLRYKDYSFLSHEACQKNPTYPYFVFRWAGLMNFFDNKANRNRKDTTRLFSKSNQNALHEGKLFCLEIKQFELNDSSTLYVSGSGVMIEKDDRYFIRGVAGDRLFREPSNEANFKYFMNVIQYIANISYEDFSKNISDAKINRSIDSEFADMAVYLFNYNFPSLLQNHLKPVRTELPNPSENVVGVGVTDIADYVDWIKHVVAEVDPYYNPST